MFSFLSFLLVGWLVGGGLWVVILRLFVVGICLVFIEEVCMVGACCAGFLCVGRGGGGGQGGAGRGREGKGEGEREGRRARGFLDIFSAAFCFCWLYTMNSSL